MRRRASPAGSLSAAAIVRRLEESPGGWLAVVPAYHKLQLCATANDNLPVHCDWDPASSFPCPSQRRKRAIYGWLQAISDSCVML